MFSILEYYKIQSVYFFEITSLFKEEKKTVNHKKYKLLLKDILHLYFIIFKMMWNKRWNKFGGHRTQKYNCLNLRYYIFRKLMGNILQKYTPPPPPISLTTENKILKKLG